MFGIFDDDDIDNIVKDNDSNYKIESLKDTVSLMLSDDYKDRFKAEYYQLKIRYEKLKDMVRKYKDGTLPFNPTCDCATFEIQLYYMKNYLSVLAYRASVENIDAENI